MRGKKAKQIRKLVEHVTSFKIKENAGARHVYRGAKKQV